jgi:hypothetical protein
VYSVAYGNGVFVAGVASGKMFYSYDGNNWASVSPDPFSSSINVYAIAYGDGKWVAVGQDGSIAQSFSAEQWEQKAVSPYGTDGYYRGIAYSDSAHGWVATGYLYSDNSGIIITSDYLESGMGFTSRTVDANNRAYYSLQDGARLYPSPLYGGTELTLVIEKSGNTCTYGDLFALASEMCEPNGDASIPTTGAIRFLALNSSGVFYDGFIWLESLSVGHVRYSNTFLTITEGSTTQVGFRWIYV